LSRESHYDTLMRVQRTFMTWVGAVAQPAHETRPFHHVCDLLVGPGLLPVARSGYAGDIALGIAEPLAAHGEGGRFLQRQRKKEGESHC